VGAVSGAVLGDRAALSGVRQVVCLLHEPPGDGRVAQGDGEGRRAAEGRRELTMGDKSESLQKAIEAVLADDPEMFVVYAKEYVVERIIHDVLDDATGETTVENAYSDIVEDLEVDVIDALVVAGDEDPDDRVRAIMREFAGHYDEVVDEAADTIEDERIYNKDSFAYHGVRRSDF
jgi:hypothetical protein